MHVLPAIDLRGGRLARGGDVSPRAVLDAWIADGATWVHLVDMDRALGAGDNTALVRRLLAVTAVRWQVGGGLTGPDVTAALDWGGSRVAVGGAGVRDLPALVSRHGRDRIALAVDIRAGAVESPPGVAIGTPDEIVAAAADADIGTIVVRDLERDGTLAGPELRRVAAYAERGFAVIVAGGIGTPDDVRAARDAGAAGVVVGRALLDGRMSLAEAFACSG